jgi:DNA-binding NtrC family response regulator
MDYHWPGNVRELQNVVERELILNPGGPLTFRQLKVSERERTVEVFDKIEHTTNLEEVVSAHIHRVLAGTKGKIHGKGGAAELLGVNASTLRNRMNKLGIEYGKKRR